MAEQIKRLIYNFDAVSFFNQLGEFACYNISESQFAQFIGRCRMYRYLPESIKDGIPELLFGETQINAICNDYFNDNNFCRQEDGSINLWSLYNLLTGANKSTYIDSFLDRGCNAFQIVKQLQYALEGRAECWYMS